MEDVPSSAGAVGLDEASARDLARVGFLADWSDLAGGADVGSNSSLAQQMGKVSGSPPGTSQTPIPVCIPQILRNLTTNVTAVVSTRVSMENGRQSIPFL